MKFSKVFTYIVLCFIYLSHAHLAATPNAFIFSSGSGKLWFLDTNTNSARPIFSSQTDQGFAASCLALSKDGKTVYIPNIGINANPKVDVISMTGFSTFEQSSIPLALSPQFLFLAETTDQKTHLIVTGYNTSCSNIGGLLFIIDPLTNNSDQFSVGRMPIHAILVGDKVYVANRDDNNITVVDLINKSTSIIIDPSFDAPIRLLAQGSLVYVANKNIPLVTVIDTTTDQVVDLIVFENFINDPNYASSVGLNEIRYHQNTLWASTIKDLLFFNLSDRKSYRIPFNKAGSLDSNLEIFNYPNQAPTLFAVNGTDSALRVTLTDPLTLFSSFGVENGAYNLAGSPDGAVYIVNKDSSSITKCPVNNSVTERISLDDGQGSSMSQPTVIAIQPSPLPPKNLSVKQKYDYQNKKFDHSLSWEASESLTTGTNIYLNDKKLISLQPSTTLFYHNQDIKPNQTSPYAITSFYDNQVESSRSTLTKTFPPVVPKLDPIDPSSLGVCTNAVVTLKWAGKTSSDQFTVYRYATGEAPTILSNPSLISSSPYVYQVTDTLSDLKKTYDYYLIHTVDGDDIGEVDQDGKPLMASLSLPVVQHNPVRIEQKPMLQYGQNIEYLFSWSGEENVDYDIYVNDQYVSKVVGSVSSTFSYIDTTGDSLKNSLNVKVVGCKDGSVYQAFGLKPKIEFPSSLSLSIVPNSDETVSCSLRKVKSRLKWSGLDNVKYRIYGSSTSSLAFVGEVQGHNGDCYFECEEPNNSTDVFYYYVTATSSDTQNTPPLHINIESEGASVKFERASTSLSNVSLESILNSLQISWILPSPSSTFNIYRSWAGQTTRILNEGSLAGTLMDPGAFYLYKYLDSAITIDPYQEYQYCLSEVKGGLESRYLTATKFALLKNLTLVRLGNERYELLLDLPSFVSRCLLYLPGQGEDDAIQILDFPYKFNAGGDFQQIKLEYVNKQNLPSGIKQQPTVSFLPSIEVASLNRIVKNTNGSFVLNNKISYTLPIGTNITKLKVERTSQIPKSFTVDVVGSGLLSFEDPDDLLLTDNCSYHITSLDTNTLTTPIEGAYLDVVPKQNSLQDLTLRYSLAKENDNVKKRIKLTWQEVESWTSYKITRFMIGDPQSRYEYSPAQIVKDSQNKVTFEDPLALDPIKAYTYFVVGVDSNGIESLPQVIQEAASVTAKLSQTSSGCTGTPTYQNILSEFSGGAGDTTYYVYRQADAVTESVTANGSKAYDVLSADIIYNYYVYAEIGNTTSVASVLSTKQVVAPQNLKLTYGLSTGDNGVKKKIRLTWKQIGSVSSYKIQRFGGENKDFGVIDIQKDGDNQVIFNDSDELDPTQVHTYCVIGVDANSVESLPEVIQEVTGVKAEINQTSLGCLGTPTYQNILSGFSGGLSGTTYYVYRQGEASSDIVISNAPKTYTVASADSIYKYYVYGVVGNTMSTAYPLSTTQVAAPQNLKLTYNLFTGDNGVKKKIRLTWKQIGDVSHYKIKRVGGGDPYFEIDIQKDGDNQVIFNDPDELDPTQVHTYCVIGVDANQVESLPQLIEEINPLVINVRQDNKDCAGLGFSNRLDWTALSNTREYILYRKGVGEIYRGVGTTYTDSQGILSDESYTYYVYAIDQDNQYTAAAVMSTKSVSAPYALSIYKTNDQGSLKNTLKWKFKDLSQATFNIYTTDSQGQISLLKRVSLTGSQQNQDYVYTYVDNSSSSDIKGYCITYIDLDVESAKVHATLPESVNNLSGSLKIDVSQLSGYIQLNWDEYMDPSRVYYRLYRNNLLIADVVSPHYQDTELEPGQIYNYTVSAVIKGVQIGDTIEGLGGTSTVSAGPLPVTNIDVKEIILSCTDSEAPCAQGSKVYQLVSWVPQGPQSNVKNYKIYKNGVLLTTLGSDASSYEDCDVLERTASNYCVTVVDTVDIEGIPRQSKETLLAPLPPENLLITKVTTPCVSSFSYKISWTRSPSDIVNYYNIYRNKELISRIAAHSPLVYQDDQVLNGSVIYCVKAVYANGQESRAAVIAYVEN